MASSEQLIARGRRVLDTESGAVAELVNRLGEDFAAACRLLLACQGRVVVTGMGKSGHIGNKIAATLASTGSPSFFLHPAEASHGDIGMITAGDVVIALSNSGETEELLTILPLLKRLGVPLIALTGNGASTLSRYATVTLDVSVPEEACPLNLAPTASTTATLAMGDALAVAVLEARGFTEEDFARSHPGGSLGRRLLLHVEEVMRRGDELPAVGPDTPLSAGLLEMSRKGLGMTTIVDDRRRVLGIFTDGDLRRALDRQLDVHGTRMREVMTAGGKVARPRMLAAEAVHIMEEHRITALPVVDDEGVLVGALNVHDLLRAGVM
jgi:arabinose-5-phosphate isomerase